MALLIDADIIAYRACSAAQHEVEFEPDEWQIYADIKEALGDFNRKVEYLVEQSSQKDFGLCFSSGTNFRKELNPEYKANRTSRKPVGYKALVEKIREKHPKRCLSFDRLEADDVLGYYAAPKHVIWSADKDLKQIPGMHLGDDGEFKVTEDEGMISFFLQVLTGDAIDNYKGCPGMGPKKAQDLLTGTVAEHAVNGGDLSRLIWSSIVLAYENAGLTEDDALLNARMAYILRKPNYNPETKKVKLWKP